MRCATQTMLDSTFKVLEELATVNTGTAFKTVFRTHAPLRFPTEETHWQIGALAVSPAIFGENEKASLETILTTDLIKMVRVKITGITLVNYLTGDQQSMSKLERVALQYYDYNSYSTLDEANPLKDSVADLAESCLKGTDFVATGDITTRSGFTTVYSNTNPIFENYLYGIETGTSRYHNPQVGTVFIDNPDSESDLNASPQTRKGWWSLITATIPYNSTEREEERATEIVFEGEVIVFTTAG